jgi:hypothetical protein
MKRMTMGKVLQRKKSNCNCSSKGAMCDEQHGSYNRQGTMRELQCAKNNMQAAMQEEQHERSNVKGMFYNQFQQFSFNLCITS